MSKSKSPNQYYAAPTTYAPKERQIQTKNLPGIHAGVICEHHGVVWAVSPHREDKRIGAQQRVPCSDYAQELLECVTIGTKDWKAASVSVEAEPIVETVEDLAQDNGELSYCLSYTVVGKGRVFMAQYHYFNAENDVEAWIIAEEHLVNVGVNLTNWRQAVLFQEDREVKRNQEARTY